MIYYDSHKNKFIPINKKDIEVKFITNNNFVTTRQFLNLKTRWKEKTNQRY